MKKEKRRRMSDLMESVTKQDIISLPIDRKKFVNSNKVAADNPQM